MSWVLYGATGYTGKLIAEHAVKLGHKPLLAGRSAEKLAPFAKSLGLEFRAVGLDDAAGLRQLLVGQKAVVHAAGPFVRTAKQMAEACIDSGAHYLDITGELTAIETVYALDERAKARGVVLVPAGGFDVVPTDCLAAYVANKAPGATKLEIDLFTKGQASGGTLASLLGVMGEGGRVRRGGTLERAPLFADAEKVRFSRGELWAFPTPLGDLASAYKSTGIPDIVTRMAFPDRQAKWLRMAGRIGTPVEAMIKLALGGGPIRNALEKRVSRVEGAGSERRARGYCQLHVRASGPNGAVDAWMETPDGYDFTYQAVVREVEALLTTTKRGALSPSLAFGVDFALGVPGVKRLDSL